MSTSKTTVSPSWTAAIGPPRGASGATWPAMKPWVAPEKRPSVSSATESPRPSPWSAAVTASISRIPGPPDGPSLRITTTSPALDRARLDRGERVLLGLEHPRRAAVLPPAVAGELDDAAVGREVAAQDREAAVGRERVGERPHDGLALGLLGGVGLLADRLAGDGDRVAVEQPGLVQARGHERHAAGAPEVGRDVACRTA